ncbi:MAG: hypothetical protein WD009_08655 [Phycisphaeraceae bacterium]
MNGFHLIVILTVSLMVGSTLAAEDVRPELPAVPQGTLDLALERAQEHVFYYTHDRSAHTTGAHSGGKMFVLALAAWQGQEQADRLLMRQFRRVLEGDRSLVAAGGYGSQHERLFTGSAVLIRDTPRLWSQLSEEDRHRVDMLMRAAMIASAYTTSDAGNASAQNSDLMGGQNLARGWNPNFREGMIGMMIVGTIWLEGDENAYAFLNDYDHDAFTQQLRDAGLDNTARTFAYAAENPDSDAPTGEQIERAVRDYTIHGTRLDELMRIYHQLTTHTYGGTVFAGLNDGQGRDGAGRIASGADELPNVGRRGMLHEFDAVDGSGPRSSITYAYTGFRPNLINHIVMIVGGAWEEGAMADECLALLRVGAADLFYKLDHGYISYANGRARGETDINHEGWDFRLTRALWEEVVEPWHAAP